MASEQPAVQHSLSIADFRPSSFGSVGIELELPILERDTSALVAGAKSVLKACADDGIEGVGAELMQSMLEVRTGPCANTSEVAEWLLPVLRRVRNISTSLGYELALVGTHPFQRAVDNAVFPDARFENTWLRLAWMTYYRVVFGLHIHIGMTSGDQAVGVMNQMIPYLPHLVALSSNSPFWQGVDTGFASCRTALYALVPHAGIPPTMSRWRDFRTYCSVMGDCGAMKSIKDIKWDVRPRPDLGTLEFRVCDMPHNDRSRPDPYRLDAESGDRRAAVAGSQAASRSSRLTAAVDIDREPLAGRPLWIGGDVHSNAGGQKTAIASGFDRGPAAS